MTIFIKFTKNSTPPSRSQISGATKNFIFCHFWGFWSKTPKNTKNPIFAKSAKIVILVYQRGDQTTFFFVYPPPLNQSLIRGGGTPKLTKMVISEISAYMEVVNRVQLKPVLIIFFSGFDVSVF